jgi:uncharacterized membrane protein YdjX (TVP38/TMEM64 family)
VKKNLIFIGIILASFAISKLMLLHQSQSSDIDTALFTTLQQSISSLQSLYSEHFIVVTIIFSLSFFILTISYIPFLGAFYVLLAGALFGFLKGAILFSFVVSISYTASFLISKFIILKFMKGKKINKKFFGVINGFESDGWIYLLSVRFSGVIPAIFINIALAFTNIRTFSFYIFTHIGIFPLVLAYSYAGSKLDTIKSLNDLISPDFFIVLLILSISPIILKMLIELIVIKLKKPNKKT